MPPETQGKKEKAPTWGAMIALPFAQARAHMYSLIGYSQCAMPAT